MAEDWLEAGPEEEDEPEAVEGIECPVCGDSFESEERMDEHSNQHSMAELFTALNSRLSKRVDQVSEGLSEQMNAQISALGNQLQQSTETSSQPEAVEEPRQESSRSESSPEELEPEASEEEEVLVGEEGERARTMAHAATETASELEKRGWSREDIAEIMSASGPFLQGLGNLLAASRGSSGPTPFEEMGRSMFEASAELNKAMFREIGKALGRGEIFGGEEESEVEHK